MVHFMPAVDETARERAEGDRLPVGEGRCVDPGIGEAVLSGALGQCAIGVEHDRAGWVDRQAESRVPALDPELASISQLMFCEGEKNSVPVAVCGTRVPEVTVVPLDVDVVVPAAARRGAGGRGCVVVVGVPADCCCSNRRRARGRGRRPRRRRAGGARPGRHGRTPSVSAPWHRTSSPRAERAVLSDSSSWAPSSPRMRAALPWRPRSRRPRPRSRTRSCRPPSCRWPTPAGRTPSSCGRRRARWP